MKIIRKIPQLKKYLALTRRKGKRIGFVPTMGALHEGHLSLIRRCKKENDVAVLSIFVNPTQFGPKEGYKTYPRTLIKDAALAKKTGADIIFCPTVSDMYPEGFATFVNVENHITDVLCGASRPGHFKGVATVVTKFLNIIAPDQLYLGQKDAQQCVVLARVVSDLNIPTQVVVCPTVREADGLAMSSRNHYLNPQERQEALALSQALQLANRQIRVGERSTQKIMNLIKKYIQSHSSGRIDYVAGVDPNTLQPLHRIRGKILLAVAVYFNRTRLIDNLVVPTYNAKRSVRN